MEEINGFAEGGAVPRDAGALTNHTSMTREVILGSTREERRAFKFKSVLIVLVAFLFVLGASYSELSPSEEGSYWMLMGFIGAIFVGFGLWGVLRYDRVFYRKYMERCDNVTEEMDYSFGSETIALHSVFDGKMERDISLFYSRINSVTEYPDLFLIAVTEGLRYAVDKSGMREGTAEELAAHLRARVGTYLVKNR